MLGGYSFISVSSGSEQSLAWVAKTHSLLVEASNEEKMTWLKSQVSWLYLKCQLFRYHHHSTIPFFKYFEQVFSKSHHSIVSSSLILQQSPSPPNYSYFWIICHLLRFPFNSHNRPWDMKFSMRLETYF